MMKKWLLGSGLTAVCISLVAWSGVSRADDHSRVGQSAKMIDIEYTRGQVGQPPLGPGVDSSSSSSGTGVESTGFETDAADGGWCPGYVCGPAFAGCNIAVTGDILQTCGLANPNTQGFWGSFSARSCSDPHIDTANPFKGDQHLRYEFDDNSNGTSDITPFPCTGAGTGPCRLSLFSPIQCADPATCINDSEGTGCCTTPLPIAPTTITAWVAKFSSISHNLEFSTQSPITSGSLGSRIIFDTDFGTLLIYVPGTGNVDTGVYYTAGSELIYKEMVQVIDPCLTRYVYFYDNTFLGTGPITGDLPLNFEQYVILTDNAPGVIDVDNIVVERNPSESPCDSVCGNGIQELGEQCDGAQLGSECVACEADCTCSPRICEFPGFSCPLGKGRNGPYVSAGGWWVYDSDSAAFGINTCGTEGANTFLGMWSLSGLGVGFENVDDDCDGGAKTYGFEADSDQLAPCFNRAGPVCVCTGDTTCANEDLKCNSGDIDCLTINLCFGGGNAGGQCNIAQGDAGCQDFCVEGLNAGNDCGADPTTCATSTCVTGPFTGTACTDSGDCSGQVCTGCENPNQACNDDSQCGGVAGDCQQVDGVCAVIGSCSGAGSCLPDAFCSGDIDSPFESCLCESYSYYWGAYYYYYNNYDTSFFYTTKGTTWLVSLDYFGALPIGSSIIINIDNRHDCKDPILTNICCNSLDGDCVDDVAGPEDCSNAATFIANKVCNPLSCPTPDPFLGSCCDLAEGFNDCEQIGPISASSCAELAQNYTWTQGAACKDDVCPPIGACCDYDAGGCTSRVTVEECAILQPLDDQRDWFKDGICIADGGQIDCPEHTGGCCDFDAGTCTSFLLESECETLVPDDAQRFWNKNDQCVADGGTTVCPEHTGGCCDFDEGTCTSFLLESECETLVPDDAQRFWNKNDQCVADGGTTVCPEHTGACCDRIKGLCTQVLESICELIQPDPNQRVWTKNTPCIDVDCFVEFGACCDAGNKLPGAATCSQTTFNDCQCDQCNWVKRGNCADLKASGKCLLNPIPTVSEWGLVILTLLLLTGAKIYFGRRRVVTA